jgi:hypothetical protein
MLNRIPAVPARCFLIAVHMLLGFSIIGFVESAVIADAVDVSGTWDLVVTSQEGTASPSITLKQDGEKIAGTYHGKMGSTAFEGTIKGDDIRFVVSLKFQDVSIAVTYSGKVSGDSMSGTARFGNAGTGNWSGKRRKNEH